MKHLIILLLLSSSTFTMAQQPTMQVWTDAWQKADPETFKNVYAENALVFPPNKPAVQTNTAILDFMKGGLGKVAVLFEPEELKMSENLAFEQGIFKDVELRTDRVIAQGKYSVTWVVENGEWKVLCHTWSMPEKGE